MKRKGRMLLNNSKAVFIIVFILCFIFLSFITFNTKELIVKEEKALAHKSAYGFTYQLKSQITQALSSTYSHQRTL